MYKCSCPRYYIRLMNIGNIQRKRPERGEIWICDLGQNTGSEQNGVRPCLVLNQKKKTERTCIIVPASRTKREHSMTICGQHYAVLQIRAVDTQRLLRRKQRLPSSVVDHVVETLHDLLQK